MTRQEFQSRVGIKVSQSCYETLIEPAYMNSDLDKDAWCKQWKRNGGVQKVIDFEINRYEKTTEIAKHYMDLNDEYKQLLGNRNDRVQHLQNELRRLKDMVKQMTNIIDSVSI